MMNSKFSIYISILIASATFSWSFRHAHAENDFSSLIDLPLEELENVQVTSVSRKPENRFKAAAAISVLTSDDIRRSGVTSIAEALRLVPGVNVARIDSNKWAISVRGFNRQFSNKLLVKIDGRTVYTPMFSGVFWDNQDLVLSDIDRIEVIRGPGATMWGANAVNGIINIITKNAEFTSGTHVSALKGNYENGTISARYGTAIPGNGAYRVYGKHVNRGETRNLARQQGNDDQWHQSSVGFRVDWDQSPTDKMRVQGDAFSGFENATALLPGLITPGVSTLANQDETFYGGNILGSWQHTDAADSSHNLQFYLDYYDRDITNIVDHKRVTFDLDYQNSFDIDTRNEFIWGAGYRFFIDDIEEATLGNGQQYLNYEPERSYNNLISAFAQNQFSLIPDELFLTVGSKLEHNYYTDLEIQPNARISWQPQSNQTLWAAISHAVRIPTRGERGLSSIALSTPGGFIRLSASGERNFDSEKMTAYEAGYRIKPAWWLSFDSAAFYNTYKDLRTFEPGVSGYFNPNTAAELVAKNMGYAETYGFEISTQIDVTTNWGLNFNYSFLEIQTHKRDGSADTSIRADEGSSPEQQIGIISRVNISENIEVDNNLFFVDQLSSNDIDNYVRFDTRIGWKPKSGIEFSLVGQDLLDNYHQEFVPFLYSRPAEVGRSVFLKATFNF